MTNTTELRCEEHDQDFKTENAMAAHFRSARLHPPGPAAGDEVYPDVTSPAGIPGSPAKTVYREDPERTEAGRALPQTLRMETLEIDHFGVGLPRAMLRTWWVFAFWLIGPLFSGATLEVITEPGPHVIVNAIALVLPIPLFLVIWSRRLMPVLRLELNEQGDRYQLRVFYAFKADRGAEGRMEIMGTRGYAVDGLEEKDRALNVAQEPVDYETTTPESLRYLCDHTPSAEKYRRKNSRLARDVIQWGSLLLLVGILVGVTFLIGNIILTERISAG